MLAATRHPAFRSSTWFTRGWTLQELIAPEHLIFVSKSWDIIGTKFTLARSVTSITGVDTAVLKNPRAIRAVGVLRRLVWASKRKTTRGEDRAYSLMGIFDVNMATLYGAQVIRRTGTHRDAQGSTGRTSGSDVALRETHGGVRRDARGRTGKHGV